MMARDGVGPVAGPLGMVGELQQLVRGLRGEARTARAASDGGLPAGRIVEETLASGGSPGG